MQIYCFSPFGYEGSLVSVEVDLRRGIPAVDIVGLADGAVKESRERMRSAIRNCGFEFPPERVLISLAPADLKKEGAGFDLAIALAVLAASESDESEKTDDTAEESDSSMQPKLFAESFAGESILVMGELELNGKVRSVRGIHAAVGTARAGGICYCIVPSANAEEAREIEGMKVFGADNLIEAYSALMKEHLFTSKQNGGEKQNLPDDAVVVNGVAFPKVESGFEFAEIVNQNYFVRALQVAAAGGHNVLAYGPPGCGKTLAMQKFPALLPLLTLEEAQPVTRIYSIAGLLPPDNPSMTRPPFRQPHQTATIEGICGGGSKCIPGEISLAHNGVLFLDEAAEFRTSVLQMLRVPLESGCITLSRAGRSTVYPSSFQLLLATNPCPCGNYGSRDKLCLCSSRAIEQYWKKFSAPLLDRVDIRVQVQNDGAASKIPAVAAGAEDCVKSLQDYKETASTEQLRHDIAAAVKIQRRRQGKCNARLTPSEIAEICLCTPEAKKLLDRSCESRGYSPRAAAGCLKVARTIADMKETSLIDESCVKEAVELRCSKGSLEFVSGML